MGQPFTPPTQPETFGPIFIGPREIYDAVMLTGKKVDGVAQQLGEVTGRVQEHETRTDERFKDQEKRTDERLQDHETRVRALEKNRWPLPAVAIVLSVAAIVVPLVIR